MIPKSNHELNTTRKPVSKTIICFPPPLFIYIILKFAFARFPIIGLTERYLHGRSCYHSPSQSKNTWRARVLVSFL